MTEPTWPVIFGESIKRHRKERGLTQKGLACLSHVRVETVQLIEAGGVDFVQEEDADRVCDVLGVIDSVVYYACGVRH